MKPLALILAALVLIGCSERNDNASREVVDRVGKRTYLAVPSAEEIPAYRETGKRIFGARTCQQCHSTTRERMGLAGPPLGGVAERVLQRHGGDALEARRWLVKHIYDPHAFPSPYAGTPEYRGLGMPPNAMLGENDLRALVEYIWALP